MEAVKPWRAFLFIMKWTVTINQVVLHQISEDLDFNDGAILSYMVDFAPRAETTIFDGNIYYWFGIGKIIEDMPMLKIKTNRGVSKRIDKLIDCGLVERHPRNQERGQSYFRFGPKYGDLIAWNQKAPLGTKVPTPLEQEFQPPWNKNSNYTNINDTSINDTKKNPAKQASIFPDQSKEVKTLFRNSLVADFEKFKKQFSGDEFKNVDLYHYFVSVSDWSEQKTVKRTAKGWVATARTWMRADLQKGKLVMAKKSGTKNDDDYEEYLKMSHESGY